MKAVYYIVDIDRRKLERTSAPMKKARTQHSAFEGFVVFILKAVITFTAVFLAMWLAGMIIINGRFNSNRSYSTEKSLTTSMDVHKLSVTVTPAPQPTITSAPEPSPIVTPEPEPTPILATGGEFVVCNALLASGCSEEIQWAAWQVCTVEYPDLVNYSTLLAQLYHESRWNPTAISTTNDYGVAQINIVNLQSLANRLGCTIDEVKFEPLWNIRAAMLVWSDNINNYSPTNLAGYLMRYNMGPGGASQHIANGTVSEYARCIIDEDIPMVRGLLDQG